MRRICLVAAVLAMLVVPASVAWADECPAVGPVKPGCPTPKPSSSPTPKPSPTPSPTQNRGQNASARPDTVEMERQFFERINRERAKRGMSRLSYNPDLTDVARKHSARMAEEGRLYHNTSELRSEQFNRRMGYPEMVGENVGEGPTVDWLHDAFMESPGHRANILESRYTSLGVGVVVKDNTIWVTQDYIRGGTAKTRSSFPKVAKRPPVRGSGLTAVPAKPNLTTIIPARPGTPSSRPIAVAPKISSLRLPPIPAPLPADDEPTSTKPLLPLAVLATLSSVAFASRKDSGAYI